MTKAVLVNYRECTGCRICEMACSIRNEGVVSTQLSRIRVYPFPPGIDVPVVCVQCDKAPCIEACPLELPGWGIRAAPGMGLAYATADRGGCHMRAWTVSREISGVAEIVKSQQDYYATCDCLVACQFVKDAVGKERYIQMLNAATGMKMTVDEFVKVGERIWNLVRMFNIREGFSRKDDTLPKRILSEPLPSGIAKCQRLTQAQLNQMLDEYYKLRGWNIQTGAPSKEKLRDLELSFVNL